MALCQYKGGYTQGMNFMAGHLLRHCSPPLAFALLTHVLANAKVDNQVVYAEGLPGVATATSRLESIMASQLPDMADHLRAVGFNYHLFMKWYMGLFASVLPAGPALDGVWDVVFSFGWDSVLYAIVALAQVVRHQVIAGHVKQRQPVSDATATTPGKRNSSFGALLTDGAAADFQGTSTPPPQPPATVRSTSQLSVSVGDDLSALDLETTCALFDALGKSDDAETHHTIVSPIAVPVNLSKRAVKLIMRAQEEDQ